MERITPAIIVLLAATAAAGCLGNAEGPGEDVTPQDVDPSLVSADGRDLTTELEATDVMEAPTWRPGHSFGHHVYFGDGVTEDDHYHYNTYVVAADESGYTLATPDRNATREEALFDLPILGHFDRDLATTAFGNDWAWYDFPLTDGKTWEATMDLDNDGEGPVTVTHTATYAAAIETEDGAFPGYVITVTDAAGDVAMVYDYVPAIGWYANLIAYDPSTEDPEDFVFKALSMGHGTGWTGTYLTADTRPLSEHEAFVSVFPFDPAVEPAPPSSFTVNEGATYLWGFAWSFAAGGVHDTMLVDPDGNTYEWRAAGTPFGGAGGTFDAPVIPGEWRVATVGVGAVSGGGLYLWEITEHVHERS